MGTNVELTPAAPEHPTGRFLAILVGLMVLLLAVLTVWTVPRPTGDLYVALAAGRDILNGKLGSVDDWSYNTQGRVWVNQNWGTHLLYYLFYKAAGGKDGHVAADEGSGEIGLLVLKLLLLLTGATFLALACRRRGAGWPVALVVAGGVMAAGRSFIDLRPNLTTLMFVPVMLHLLYRTAEKPSRSWLVMIVFGLVWANLHGGFFLGLVTMGLWCVCLIAPQAFVWHDSGQAALPHREQETLQAGRRMLRRQLLGLVWAAAAGLVVWVFATEGGWSKSAFPAATVAALVVLAACVVIRRRRDLAAGDPEEVKAAYRAALGAWFVGRWQFIAATVGAWILAGVVTPFGVHNLFRDYSKLSMSFGEIWNLTHPFVVMAGRDSELWRSVIEWHSPFSAEIRTFGTTWEFFGIVGLFCVLVPLHMVVKLARRKAVTPGDLVLLVGIVALTIAVFAQALPTWGGFERIVSRLADRVGGASEMSGVLRQKAGWLAAVIAYLAIGVVAIGVGVAAVYCLITRRVVVERWSARRVGTFAFDVIMAALGIAYFAFGARRFIPLSLLLLAPLLAPRVQWLVTAMGSALAWLVFPQPRGPKPADAPARRAIGASVLRIVPTVLVGAAVFFTIAVQARHNLARYLPYSPTVRYKSMLRNMIVYQMFPPNCKDFLVDNDLGGRVFNEWRWEGYLRWYCPECTMFLGGRAQQAYHLKTYKLQRRILAGEEPLATLDDRGVRWIVVPMNPGYNRLLTNAVYVPRATWVPIFCDGENVVLANSRVPECLEVIGRCLAGKLKYREPALKFVSQGFCFSSRAVGDVYVARKPPGKDEKLVREEVRKNAVAALKESHKYRPIYMAYAALSDLYRTTRVQPTDEIAHLEKQYERLVAMEYERLGGIEILRCRRWVAHTLALLYKATEQMDKHAWAVDQTRKTDELLLAVSEEWR
jgi:hypothetical protein